MPKMLFTTRGIEALKPKGHAIDYWSTDPAEPGFGVRVFPSGKKSWFLYTRQTRVGRGAVRLTIGAFPALGLAKAREAAADERAKVKLGQDPAAARRAERAANRDTVRALFNAYSAHVELRRQAGEFRSWPDVRRSLERDVLPSWGDRPARDIRRKDVLELVTRKALDGPIAANRCQAHIGMLFAYGVETDWITGNPAARLRKRKEHPRDRVLSADELRALWQYLDAETPIALSRGVKAATKITMAPATAATLRDLFKLLLLCGQRLGETARMSWADVDLDARLWTIPATETKNRSLHRVPLSRPVLALLTARQEADPVSPYVFPSAPASLSSVLVWAKRSAKPIGAGLGVPFVAHDCRRTMATMLGEMGIARDTIGLVLNHTRAGVTGKCYDLSTREAAKRTALDRWADRLDAIVAERRAAVIPIKGRTRRAR